MTVIKGQLGSILRSVVLMFGCEFVGSELLQLGSQTVLRVYIDSESGVNINLLEQVSRQLTATLNVEKLLPGHYTLEVSSPGLDRPLFKIEDYYRFIGRLVKLRLCSPREGGRRNYTGVLMAADIEQITLQIDQNELVVLSFKDIEKANLVPEFK